MVAKDKEDSDEESELEEVETFICNEKIYWGFIIFLLLKINYWLN